MSVESTKSVRVGSKASASYRALLVAFGIAALSIGTAQAQTEPGKATVKYQDLDLSKPAAAKILYKRLQTAARHVCSSNDSRGVSKYRAQDACYQEALERAVEDVGHASVNALYAEDDSIRVASRRSESRTST